ncbi:argininosuccinate lyase [Azorhizobium doebereinerae]|uniref:argininosuccinate lyase n=1 Tax=Azorhizobium doebereinerae TaxID=281091 RepID=UPI00040998C6|nr:argininosuccinate lyase [Azorhizobium doebereinerae]
MTRALENTGRIAHGLCPGARHIVFGDTADAAIDSDLWLMTEIDRAHVVMLCRRGLLPPERAAPLLALIAALRVENFASLRGRPAPRGLYLLYESLLIERLGGETGGALHTGRSRNDLGATLFRLKLRVPARRLLRELLRLEAVLLSRARRHLDVVMPAYTHFQPALPVTFGHWLAGIACAVGRDARALLDGVLPDLDHCPLGAGAVGGTSFPIDPRLTARLLGFTDPVGHSIDAVASRDCALRLLSAAGILGVTLSRMATDLLVWSTPEFGFLRLPDGLVGSSSMMPQKRNPFLLEHVQGLAAKPLGAFVTAAAASHAKPFSNTIAANTEGVGVIWEALRAITDAVTLSRLVIAFARPAPAAMRRSATAGFTAATELANQLARAGVPFREAHHQVGAAIAEALAAGGRERLHETVTESFADRLESDADAVSLDAVVAATRFGGGPAATSVRAAIAAEQAGWRTLVGRGQEIDRRWRHAAQELDAADHAIGEARR